MKILSLFILVSCVLLGACAPEAPNLITPPTNNETLEWDNKNWNDANWQ